MTTRTFDVSSVAAASVAAPCRALAVLGALVLSPQAVSAACPSGFVSGNVGGQLVCVQSVAPPGQVQELTDLAQNQRLQVAVLEERLDNTREELNLVFILLGVVGTLGALGSLITWYLPYRREGRAQNRFALAEQAALQRAETTERRADSMHEVFLRSEQRAETVHLAFLEGSQETLNLVNETLRLARDASQRAADEVIRRATDVRDELGEEARGLLAEVAGRDDRALVSDPDRRSRLRTLAQKIAGFESNKIQLHTDVELKPHSVFIRGMDFHLGQQFTDAVKYWEAVALDEASDNDLKSLAWYWIGYENNNRGAFSDAYQSFENALRHASGPRQFELRRMLLETRFFQKEAYPPETLIEPLRKLADSMAATDEEEVQDRLARVLVTLGNVCLTAAHETEGSEERKQQLLNDAKTAFKGAMAKDKWARFTLAQVKWELGKRQKAIELFRDSRQAAQDEFTSRHEPRTKVLARMSELICCSYVPEFKRYVPGLHGSLLDKLGDVDERLTIYSQLTKRNVSKKELTRQLTDLVASSETN